MPVEHQQRCYRNRSVGRAPAMSDERVRLLLGVEGFRFDPPGPEPVDVEWEWEERFRALREHKERHGTASVSRDDDEDLRRWVAAQRAWLREDAAAGRVRVRKLESLGVVTCRPRAEWPSYARRWEDSFKALVRYKEKHGTTRVLKSIDRKLSQWVITQRKYFILRRAGGDSPMTEERIRLLESIGFEWEVVNPSMSERMKHLEDEWSKRLDALKKYKEKHGTTRVKERVDKGLHCWVLNQRRLYRLRCEGKSSTMSDERLQSLTEIGFEWVVRSGPVSGVANGEGRRKPKEHMHGNNEKEDMGGAQRKKGGDETTRVKAQQCNSENRETAGAWEPRQSGSRENDAPKRRRTTGIKGTSSDNLSPREKKAAPWQNNALKIKSHTE